MGATTNNYLTITPAEGYDALPTDLIEKLAYKTPNGYEVDFELGVPIRYRGGGRGVDEYIYRIWGGDCAFETYEVTVADGIITANFENKEDAPTNWVKNLSKKFPTAVFHLSFLNDYWNYGGEVTAKAGVLSNEITENTATADRGRATHMPDMTDDDFLGWEAQDAYLIMFPERSNNGHPNDGWMQHVLEIGAEQIIPAQADQLTRLLSARLLELEQREAERVARISG